MERDKDIVILKEADDRGMSFTSGLLIGALIGVAAGILLAPKPGAQTRAELSAQVKHWRSKAEETAARMCERAGCIMDSTRETVSQAAEKTPSDDVTR